MDERYPYTLTHSDDRSPTKDSGLVLIYRGKIRKTSDRKKYARLLRGFRDDFRVRFRGRDGAREKDVVSVQVDVGRDIGLEGEQQPPHPARTRSGSSAQAMIWRILRFPAKKRRIIHLFQALDEGGRRDVELLLEHGGEIG